MSGRRQGADRGGDATSDLFEEAPRPAPEPARAAKAKPKAAVTPVARRLMDAADKIRGDLEPERRLYQHTVFCQTGLPYVEPPKGERHWTRRQGNVTLRVLAGEAMDPVTGDFVPLGLPYGEQPRLVLMHLNEQALLKKSPLIDVERSMTAFAASLGVQTNGRALRQLKEQLARLAASQVRLGIVEDGHAVTINTQVVSGFDLWFPQDPGQSVLWPSTVRLSLDYFDSLTRHAVPLNHDAIRALKHTAMGLDAYAWLAQRLHRVPPGKPQLVPWAALHEQFGPNFARVRDFRKKFLGVLVKVRAVYPEARMDHDERGVLIEQSPPPVPPRQALCALRTGRKRTENDGISTD